MNRVLLILVALALPSMASAYDCPTNGCYGYSPSQAQDAYNQQQYQTQIIQQNEQILQQQQNMQNQLNSFRN